MKSIRTRESKWCTILDEVTRSEWTACKCWQALYYSIMKTKDILTCILAAIYDHIFFHWKKMIWSVWNWKLLTIVTQVRGSPCRSTVCQSGWACVHVPSAPRRAPRHVCGMPGLLARHARLNRYSPYICTTIGCQYNFCIAFQYSFMVSVFRS